jgi:coatomer protein complex subunit gamma
MVQYHALSLLYSIKQHDRLAVSKIVQQMSRGSLRSPLATCLLIRYTSNLLHEDMGSTSARAAYVFLENCLRHKNEMVVFEAARAVCTLPNVEANDLHPAIAILQLFLSSPKPSLRFAAMRALSELAGRHPLSVSKCNDDMEALVQDSNRSVATLAITTLLKTGNEGNIDRLMKQISSFMGEIGDEFKIVVVRAVRELCVKYPSKHRTMVSFLATFLREEGGYDFKRCIVDSIVELMNSIPDTKESSLLHLCEFIEDCEFAELIVQIMHLIGSVGVTVPTPSKYIRFIFNRIILENATVRAAAVSTLGAFATHVPELRPSLVVLLRRSLADDDDEVRDRAAILLRSLDSEEALDSIDVAVLDAPLPMSFTALERSAKAYMAHPSAGGVAMTFATLPVIEEAAPPPSAAKTRAAAKKAKVATSGLAPEGASAAGGLAVDPAAELYARPELASLGRAFRSAPEVPLTETEMEYVVGCTKHIFEAHVVLQFSVLNTVDDQCLRDVSVDVQLADDSYDVQTVIPAPSAKYGEKASTYVVLARQAEEPAAVSMSCELHFKVHLVAVIDYRIALVCLSVCLSVHICLYIYIYLSGVCFALSISFGL